MTNRLELNWNLDGFVDEQRYYCSETPFTAETKPMPKAVLANDVRMYIDTAIEEGKTHYVAVGSVKNNVEKLSETLEISSAVEYADTYLELEKDYIDRGLRPSVFVATGVVLSEGYAAFNGVSSMIESSLKSELFNFGTGDFTIEVTAKVNSNRDHTLIDLRDIYNLPTWQAQQFYANILKINNSALIWSNGARWHTAQFDLVLGHEYVFAVTREAGVLRMFVNKVKLAEVAEAINLSRARYLRIGATREPNGMVSGVFDGSIRHVRVIKGLARHTNA